MTEAKYQIKGPGIIGSRDWLDARFGPGYFNGLAREHTPDFPERLLPGDWYPLHPMVHVFARSIERFDEYDTVEQLVEMLSGENAKRDLNGIYRAFLWVASPRMFLRASPTIWGTYSNVGTVAELHNDPNCFVAQIVGVPEELLEWACGAWKGFLPPAIVLAGGTNPRATVLERKPSADAWEFTLEFRYD